MKVGKRILRTALIAGSALGLTAGGTALALSSGPAQAATACAAAWSSTAVYTAGMQASENGTNYTANWWTQGNDPATNNGGPGSGQPWTSNGACAGGSGREPEPHSYARPLPARARRAACSSARTRTSPST